MKITPEIEINGKINKYWVVTIIFSVMTAVALLISSSLEAKWLVASMIAIIGIYICFVIQKELSPFLLFLAVFAIPLKIDYYLLYKPTYFVETSGLPGLPVSLFDIVLIILSLHLCFQILLGKHKFKFYPSISIPVIIYLIISGISAFRSADLSLSFSLFILMVKSYIAFLFFANRIRTKSDLKIVIFALIMGVLLQSIIGGIQSLSGGTFLKGVFGIPEAAFRTQIQGEYVLSRIGGTIGHPNALAKYLCFCIPVLLAYGFSKSDPAIKKLALFTTLLACWTLLGTLSRGSWVALGLTFSFFFYETFKYYFKSRLKSIVMVILFIGIIVGATLSMSEDVRIRLFKDDYGSAKARLPMAVVALNIIKEHPITGVGLNNYTTVMHNYDHTRESQTYRFPHPVHNSYLLIAAESGIPALIVFLWLIGVAMAKGWPALKSLKSSVSLIQLGLLGGLITWLIAAMFDRDFPGINIMFWLTIAMLAACQHISSMEDEKITYL